MQRISEALKVNYRFGTPAFALMMFALAGCSAESGQESIVATTSALSNHSVQVGTRCQQDYQNSWQTDVGGSDVWNRCSGFQTTAATQEVNAFYYNLHGAKAGFENSDTCGWACGYIDAVDFFYTNTHGGSNNSTSYWAMWDQNSWAYTSNMRLGSSGRENMIFATFSCDTQLTDSHVWTRWYPVFAGGMVETLGSHGLLYAGNTGSGSNLATRMNNGEAIGQSWLESTWYADNRNKPTVLTTGTNSSNCWSRQGVKYDTLFSTGVLRDGSIGYMCWTNWD